MCKIFSTFVNIFLLCVGVNTIMAVYAAEHLENHVTQLEKVDINQADAATLAQALDGVGMVKAQEIVAYREQFGNFRSIDQLAEVSGIGPATIERNRDRILVRLDP
mgnify:CR=1 FL=1